MGCFCTRLQFVRVDRNDSLLLCFLCVFVYLCVSGCIRLFACVCGLYVKCRKAGQQWWTLFHCIRSCCFSILSKEMQTSKPYIPEISHQHCWCFEAQMWINSAFTDTNTQRDTHTNMLIPDTRTQKACWHAPTKTPTGTHAIQITPYIFNIHQRSTKH